jgi:hypothetical protein
MQFYKNEPYWADALSGLIKSTGQAAGAIGSSYFQAKNRKELEQKEKAQKEATRMRTAQSFSSMLGLSPEQSMALADASPDIQKAIMQQILDRGGFQNMSRMGGMQQGMGAQQSPMSALQGLQSPVRQQTPQGGLTMSNMAQSLRPEDPNAFLAQRVLQGAAIPSAMEGKKLEPQKEVSPSKMLDAEISQAVRNYDIDKGIGMNPTNISGLLGSGMSKDDAKQALKDTAEYDKKLRQETHAAKDLVRITNDMTNLIEKDIASGGKLLRGPGTQTLLNSLEGLHGKAGFGGLGSAIGGILGTLVAPGVGTAIGASIGAGLGGLGATAAEGYIKSKATKETQAFEKYSAEFIKGAKGIFGSRITDADLNQFMKMVPTLMNTNEGKLAVLRNIQLVNEATLVKGKIRDKIVKENGGRRPYNLEDMVEDISDPIINKMTDQFKRDTDALFAKYEQPAEQPKKSALPGLPGGYNANEL